MDVSKYLTDNEVIDKTFTLKGFEVHATNKRIFVSSDDGDIVQDYVYEHISSMLFTAKHYHWLIVIGIAIVAASLIFKVISRSPFQVNFDLFWIGIAIGVAIALAGAFLKKEVLRLFVIGVPGPREFQADREDLEALFKTVREEKEANQSPPTVTEE